jgi:hypothetical protein
MHCPAPVKALVQKGKIDLPKVGSRPSQTLDLCTARLEWESIVAKQQIHLPIHAHLRASVVISVAIIFLLEHVRLVSPLDLLWRYVLSNNGTRRFASAPVHNISGV